MKAIKYYLLVLALFLLPAFSAFGQRTMKGQIFIDATGGWTPVATLGVGGYLIPGYWYSGVEGLRMRKVLAQAGSPLTEHLDTYHLKARGGYMQRLVGTRSRSVSLYAGGDAWVGLESVDPFNRLSDDYVLSINDGNTFVFGVTPRLEAEFFLGKIFAFTLGGRLPFAFLSRIRMMTWQGMAGIRIAF